MEPGTPGGIVGKQHHVMDIQRGKQEVIFSRKSRNVIRFVLYMGYSRVKEICAGNKKNLSK